MKKVIYLSIMFLMISLTISAQAAGGQITRKKANTTTTTATPKKTTHAPKKTTSAAKTHSSGKPRSATFEMTNQDRVIQNLIDNMVFVQGGMFMMGGTIEQGNEVKNNEKPAHQVILTSFSIGRYEVTQEEWQAVMGSNPSDFKSERFPVENVSWDDCQVFIQTLNAKTGKTFRLPTEAEWEYAARGGNKTNGYKYAGSNDISNHSWYSGNSNSRTHEVGSRQPNELGLYDISGNVMEWCQDWFDNYRSSAQSNPTGPSFGSFRICRGGCWSNDADRCRVSYRNGVPASTRINGVGLRLAL